jgi:hypothetical protein
MTRGVDDAGRPGGGSRRRGDPGGDDRGVSDESAHNGVVLLVNLAVTFVLLVLAVVSSPWWFPVALAWGVISIRQVAVLRRSG